MAQFVPQLGGFLCASHFKQNRVGLVHHIGDLQIGRQAKLHVDGV